MTIRKVLASAKITLGGKRRTVGLIKLDSKDYVWYIKKDGETDQTHFLNHREWDGTTPVIWKLREWHYQTMMSAKKGLIATFGKGDYNLKHLWINLSLKAEDLT